MAMPNSGSIAIISAPQTCGSICAAVGVASGSLTTLSACAGKTAPHSMLEFYGYAPAPAFKSIFINCIASTCPNGDSFDECTCGILATSASMVAGDCYFPAFSWSMGKASEGLVGTISVQVLCNGVSKYCCAYSGKLARNCSGSWLAFCVDSNDTINLITCAKSWDYTTPAANATITITNINVCVGCYCLGSPSQQTSYACGGMPES